MAPKKITTSHQPSHFQPFPKNSVNLVTGPTSIGKTYFVTQLLSHHNLYFQSPVNRILIILCNDRIQPVNFESEIQVEQIPIADFDPEHLEEHDLVVIDDLQAITENIRLTISVCAHHYNLASLFIITHSVLGNSHFELLNLCHRVFLFLRSRANVRLVKYIISNFYQDPEVQQSLKNIITFCQRKGEVLALELNPIASYASDIQLIGFSHLTLLHSAGYFLLYTPPQVSMDYEEEHSHSRVDSELAQHIDLEDLPQNTLIVVPASSVKASQKHSTKEMCSDEQQWTNTTEEIEEMINENFKQSRWKNIKILAKEILKREDLCVYTNGRYFHKKGKPKTKVNMLDFLGTATRQVMKGEKTDTPEYKLFGMYARMFLDKGIRTTVIQNKKLLV